MFNRLRPDQNALLGSLLIGLPLMLPVLATPYQIDNTTHRILALEWMYHGPAQIIGQNFPGIIFIHALSIVLFGNSDVGYRIFDIIVQLLFSVFLFKFLHKWLRHEVAALAVILYLLYYASAGGPVYGQPDVYEVICIIISLYLLLYYTKSVGRTLVAGIVGGFAVILRPTAVLTLLPIILYLWAEIRPKRFLFCFLYIAGCAAPLTAVFLLYSAIPNGSETWYFAMIRFNLDVYSQKHASLHSFYDTLKGRGPFVALAIFGACRRVFQKNHSNSFTIFNRELTSNESKLYSGILLSFLIVVFLQWRFLPYHWAPVYIMLVPVVAIAIRSISQSFSRARPIIIVGLFLLCSLGTLDVRPVAAFARAVVAGSNPFAAAYASYYDFPKYGAKEESQVIAYLEKKDRGPVELLSYTPELRLHLRRPFVSAYPVPNVLAFHGSLDPPDSPFYTVYQRAWQEEYMRSLEIGAPNFLIFGKHTRTWELVDPYESWLRFMPRFDSFVESNYRYDTCFGWYELWRRNK